MLPSPERRNSSMYKRLKKKRRLKINVFSISVTVTKLEDGNLQANISGPANVMKSQVLFLANEGLSKINTKIYQIVTGQSHFLVQSAKQGKKEGAEIGFRVSILNQKYGNTDITCLMTPEKKKKNN